LRKTIFAGLTATATCVASVLSHNPAAMLAAGMGALQTMRALVTRLSDVELEVCVAISEIMRVRQSEGFSRLGATQEEVVARMRQDAPANLHDIIVKLTGGSSPVLKTDVDGGVTRYSVS
jgi:hypothetical protein